MITRSIESELELWKSSKHRKPLVLRGARQVGKTTVINSFSKQYDNYLYANLEDSAMRDILERDLPLDDKIALLFTSQEKIVKPGTTLLFM